MLILGLKELISEHKQETRTVLFIFCTGNGVVMS